MACGFAPADYLLPCVQGEKTDCFALTEPGAGSDANSIKTRAVRDGDAFVINGSAVGAGMDLALCCDFRIAAASARFKAGYTGMAYCPDAGASWHLPRLLGSEAAKRLLFLDEAWSAERALGAGLVGEVVADERLVEAVGAFAARLASGPTFAFAQTKRLLRDGAGRSLAEQLRAEQAAGLLCGRSEDAAEALRAVAEKRSPQFSGR